MAEDLDCDGGERGERGGGCWVGGLAGGVFWEGGESTLHETDVVRDARERKVVLRLRLRERERDKGPHRRAGGAGCEHRRHRIYSRQRRREIVSRRGAFIYMHPSSAMPCPGHEGGRPTPKAAAAEYPEHEGRAVTTDRPRAGAPIRRRRFAMDFGGSTYGPPGRGASQSGPSLAEPGWVGGLRFFVAERCHFRFEFHVGRGGLDDGLRALARRHARIPTTRQTQIRPSATTRAAARAERLGRSLPSLLRASSHTLFCPPCIFGLF